MNRGVKISYVAHAKLVQNVWTRNQGSRGSILTGVKFCFWNFLFSCVEAYDANIGIIANFV